MKRRLNLLTGLVHRPRVLLLDEATVGIDPQGRIAILDMVRAVAEAGTTVIYTTHYLEEAEELCRRVAILDHGRILAEGTVSELMKSIGEGEIVALGGSFKKEAIVASLEGRPEIRLLGAEDGRVLLSAALPGPEVFRLLDRVLADVPSVEEISIRKPSLQSLFIKLTGREIRD
jgi:ABC-2 type transport system ATP-binding protein